MARAPLFRGLGDEARDQLVALARDQRVARREAFFEQGDPAHDVLLLCSGRLKLTQYERDGEQVILRLTGPGEVFGAIDVEPGGTYASGATALEPSYALVWDRGTLDALAERHGALTKNALRILAERMRGLEQRCRELTTLRVACRVARTLLRLVGQVGQASEDGTLVGLTREELAQLTGTTLFSVSRLLGEWESLGLVRPRREAVVVLDSQGLAAFADGDARRHVAVADR